MKRLFNITLLLNILLFATHSIAGNTKILGLVTDAEHSEPLVAANIYIEGTQFGSTSSTTGEFELNLDQLEPGNYTLICSYIGYYEYQASIQLIKNQTLKHNIVLKESALTLDQIVVTGTRSERLLKHSPVSTQLIKKETIIKSGASDLAELLSSTTGVNVTSNGIGTGTSTVELQGFGSEHVMILVDGMKMIGRVDGKLDVSQIPSSLIERIEIVKGATSTLYGSEAMGGVINVITKQPKDELSFDSNIKYGSYGKLDTDFSVGSDFLGFQPLLNVSYRKHDGYDLDKKTTRTDATSYDKYQTQLKVRKQFSEYFDVILQTHFHDEVQTITANDIFKNRISNDYFTANTKIEHNWIKNAKITTISEFSTYNHHFDQIVISSGFLKKGEAPTTENLFKNEILFSHESHDYKINGGVGFETESLKSDRIKNTEADRYVFNSFFQNELILSSWTTIVLGGRFDKHSIFGEQFTPKASLMFSPSYNNRIRLSYAQGFRVPTFKDRLLDYYNSSVNYLIKGNLDLRPEHSNAYNLGFEFWSEKQYHSRLNFFYNRISNLIDYQVIGKVDGALHITYMNVENAQTWGAEWDMEYYPTSWLETSIGYNYFDSYSKKTKTPLQFKPKHRVNLRFSLSFPNNIVLNILGQVTSKKFSFIGEDFIPIDGNKIWIDGYYLVNANINFPVWNQVSGQVGVNNLNDYVDKVWGPMPGREFFSSIKINL
ncbi:MAG: TonB-dependent receptor [Calditrichaeota bacterium]|nr:MAG: TonB-dependent receptor [Calditrichota bacterium]MBL1204576.1 TonB-dependent receptor [Calditrichota bacterium]NOG44405.1 TonB-dependent receptor [Calditrichota bacterium]